MNRIRLLPEQVANQIAAGEVIERPASVVKELVENALDAGATRLVIEIEAGGRSLIRVTDDGWGMSRDDALLCLEPHATSKIRTADDLAAITTLGFRGEALPSIASVSRFVLTTREGEDAAPEATQVIVHGGKLLEVRSAGHAPGTTVEVRHLFYNLPARRKFLRSEETERAHIIHYLTLAALANPEVGFTLRQDQRLLWQLPPLPAGTQPSHGVRERLRTLLGPDLNLLSVEASAALGTMVETDGAGEDDAPGEAPRALRVWGFIGAPGVSRATRQDQHLFVNRRPVENRGLNYALLEGYHTALMKGRYPVCCLFLEIEPAEVDVNVHPTKREVKFRHEQAVRQQVANAVRSAIVAFHTRPAIAAAGRRDASPIPQVPPPVPPESTPLSAPVMAPIELTFDTSGPVTAGQPPVREPVAVSPPPPVVSAARAETVRPSGGPTAGWPEAAAPPAAPVPPPSRPLPGTTPVPLLQVPLRLIGVIGNLYVVLESDRGLVLMDQHAAHERVLYEQMLRRLEQGEVPSQRLLLPETVELSVRDAEFLQANLAVLSRLGVGLSEFGERTFLLDALPPFVRVRDARRFVFDLIDELAASGRAVNSMRLGEQSVAKTVCRHAVKANDPLSGSEMENLVNDLRSCAMPYTCPHGRPTLIEFNYRELEKKFGRIQ